MWADLYNVSKTVVVVVYIRYILTNQTAGVTVSFWYVQGFDA